MSAARFLRFVAGRAMLVLFLGVVAAALGGPARADDDHHDRGPERHEEHGHDRHAPRYRYVRPPPPEVVYAPPPVLYAPPPPPAGLTLIIPFDFR